MSEEGHPPDQAPDDDAEQRRFANAAWSIPSTILSGMIVYGGLGWLLDRWWGTSAMLPIGVLTGLGLALYSVYLRFGR